MVHKTITCRTLLAYLQGSNPYNE
ncbi:MAG: hypothetical protein E7006_01110 [Alphaproteobacteria bacterium]|nr:hypothetical protein [Alphaproteobacteria bacterium]